MTLSLSNKLAAAITAGHIGSVQNVLAGRLPPQLEKRRFKASDYQYGFELGSSEGVQALGEALLVNGQCYSTSTDPNSANYKHTVFGEYFFSSGIFVIPEAAKPSYQLIQQFETPVFLSDIFDELYATIQQPFCFAALCEFEEVQGMFVIKSPIYNERIFDNLDSYVSQPLEVRHNTSAFLIGVVADYNNQHYEKLLQKFEVVLYRNPFDKEHKISSHAHGITLKQAIQSSKEIRPELVDKTWHIVSDKSKIQGIQAEIFVIEDLVDVS